MFQSRPKGQKKCSDQHSFNFLSQVSEQVCVDSIVRTKWKEE